MAATEIVVERGGLSFIITYRFTLLETSVLKVNIWPNITYQRKMQNNILILVVSIYYYSFAKHQPLQIQKT